MVSDAFPCQLLVDPPTNGAWNMALDEALLRLAAKEGIATLRFYQWEEPTLSLGYFQKFVDCQSHPASLSATLVRRQSGGGAILHDRELTYSIALPAQHPYCAKVQGLYDVVHRVLVSVLQRYVSHAERIEMVFMSPPKSGKEPFLCFQRRAVGDIVFVTSNHAPENQYAHKIVGSAQRRHQGAVLQHGSLLLERSQLAPELPGFNDLSGLAIKPESVVSELLGNLPQELNLKCFPSKVCQKVHFAAETCYNDKYGSAHWTTKR